MGRRRSLGLVRLLRAVTAQLPPQARNRAKLRAAPTSAHEISTDFRHHQRRAAIRPPRASHDHRTSMNTTTRHPAPNASSRKTISLLQMLALIAFGGIAGSLLVRLFV
ncbi:MULTISPECIES: hypothetical protein [unclassified Paraburkholderia]|uniref:hypothetical protein n=1 Tax=unclassified Paraburkholderia TaxID=2615204 RepID=UPI00286F0AC8|nr:MULTISPECIES: hypothetical protein [unclassified Paraburkholderia]